MLVGQANALRRYHALSDVARRHRESRLPQHIIDQPQRLTGAKPGSLRRSLPGTIGSHLNLRVKQLHGLFEMGKPGGMLHDLLLTTVGAGGQLPLLIV